MDQPESTDHVARPKSQKILQVVTDHDDALGRHHRPEKALLVTPLKRGIALDDRLVVQRLESANAEHPAREQELSQAPPRGIGRVAGVVVKTRAPARRSGEVAEGKWTEPWTFTGIPRMVRCRSCWPQVTTSERIPRSRRSVWRRATWIATPP